MNILLLGPQGSGKGTQADLLVEKFGYYYMGTGKFLRELAKNRPDIDERINKKGELLPDEETVKLVSEHLEENKPDFDNILFDGFPRTVNQYDLFNSLLTKKGRKIDKGVLIDISEEESVKRLSGRRMHTKSGEIYNLVTNLPPSDIAENELVQRPDDKPEAIKKRLSDYHKMTAPLVELFRSKGALIEVNGEQPIDKVFSDIIVDLKV